MDFILSTSWCLKNKRGTPVAQSIVLNFKNKYHQVNAGLYFDKCFTCKKKSLSGTSANLKYIE